VKNLCKQADMSSIMLYNIKSSKYMSGKLTYFIDC
jgi:hypothetical protein